MFVEIWVLVGKHLAQFFCEKIVLEWQFGWRFWIWTHGAPGQVFHRRCPRRVGEIASMKHFEEKLNEVRQLWA